MTENENEIKRNCERYNIHNWTINKQTGLVDVDGSVNLDRNSLTELPLNFGNVNGSFWCYGNKLTTLKGAPKTVGGNFNCSYNNIQTRHKLPSVGNKMYYDTTMKWLF